MQALVQEPFNLALAEIADLTTYQLAKVLFRPKEDEPSPTAASSPEGIREKIRIARMRKGLPPEPPK